MVLLGHQILSARGARKELGSCSQMQKLREGSREMSRVYGAEGRQHFCFSTRYSTGF